MWPSKGQTWPSPEWHFARDESVACLCQCSRHHVEDRPLVVCNQDGCHGWIVPRGLMDEVCRSARKVDPLRADVEQTLPRPRRSLALPPSCASARLGA